MEVDMKRTLVYGIRYIRPDGNVFMHNLIYKNKREAEEDMNMFASIFPEYEYQLASFYLV